MLLLALVLGLDDRKNRRIYRFQRVLSVTEHRITPPVMMGPVSAWNSGCSWWFAS